MVDLGTGSGIFAIDAAGLGWRVTAVDARTDRLIDHERVVWMNQDVRDHDLAPYDLIACLGLFYHLTLDDQLDLLARASGRPLIIDTALDHGTHRHALSERVVLPGGYEGRMYREPNKVTSSWMNESSFWPTLDSFHRMLSEQGFNVPLTVEPWLQPHRTFFLALPD